MSAELQKFMEQLVPKDVTKWQVAQQSQQLRKQAVKLTAAHKQQKQVGHIAVRPCVVYKVCWTGLVALSACTQLRVAGTSCTSSISQG